MLSAVAWGLTRSVIMITVTQQLRHCDSSITPSQIPPP